MNKVIVISLLGLLLVGCVSAFTINYSKPTYQDGTSINWQENNSPEKNICNKNEWNNNFDEYRNGLISKEDMKNYVRGCKW
jgi:hypothetical protein